MIEAVPILFVAAVAVASYAGARAYAAGPVDRAGEMGRVKARREWLINRLQRARDEQWGAEMESQLLSQLAALDDELQDGKP